MPSAIAGYPFAELWHPEILLLMAALGVLYALVVGPLYRRLEWGTEGAGGAGGVGATPGQMAAFAGALAVFYLAEGTPLHILSARFLFSAHMVQHVLMTMVLPPLLLLGAPGWLLRRLLRPRSLGWAFRLLTHPLPALALFNLVYSVWHLPSLYQAALYSQAIHMLEHALLVATALIMWWPLLSPLSEYPRLSDPAQILYAFLMSAAQVGVFGYITFSSHILYEFYARAHRVWGLTPQADQQLAGIVMKVGGLLVVVVVMAAAFFRWARREETGAAGPSGLSGGTGQHI